MNTLLRSILIICFAVLIHACQDNSAYQSQIQSEIDNRIKFLQYNDDSPFIQFDVAFTQPSYFPIDATYRVNATVERIKDRSYQVLGTSDGKTQRYLEYAWLHFHLGGKDHKLLVLKPVGMSNAGIYYLAFADETSGASTYGGGRYLDITLGKSNKIVLDFNLAYNPYCAYVPDYSCPLPPSDNLLDVAIPAGEKDFLK